MEYRYVDLGLIEYQKAIVAQQETFDRVAGGEFPGAILFCRHYPVITLGRSGRDDSLRVSTEELKRRGIAVYRVQRGGDATYHGPGQLTVYPVLDLRYLKQDIHWYLRSLESVVIEALGNFGIAASRRPSLTGVWVGCKKIASIGIAIRRWVTFHGISIAVGADDLANFQLIKPCGMEIEMTCLEAECGRQVTSDELKAGLTAGFSRNAEPPGFQSADECVTTTPTSTNNNVSPKTIQRVGVS